MRTGRGLTRWVFAVLLAWGVVAAAVAEPGFDAGWNVERYEPAQASGALVVKAAGWKLLAMDVEKTPETPWFSEGDEMQNWAWKVEVSNPSDRAASFSMAIQLISSMGYYYQTLERDGLSIEPGATAFFEGQGAYDATSHEREGGPARLQVTVQPAE